MISLLCHYWQLAIIIAISFPVLWGDLKNRDNNTKGK